MSDSRPNLSKKPAAAGTSGSASAGKPAKKTVRNPGSATMAPRPTAALAAAIAVAVSALFGVIASIGLYVQTTWIESTSYTSLVDANKKLKKSKQKSLSDLHKQAHDQIAATHKGALIGALILVVALGFIAVGIYKGRYWSRWGTLGIWALCSFTQTLVGFPVLFSVTKNVPIAIKVPAFLGALALIAAVVLTFLKPAAQWFALSKPVPAAGGARRGGLFAPRPAAGSARTGAATRPAETRPASTSQPDRSRSKKRASDAQAVAKGADLARTRAKAASKSRRTEA